MSAEETMFRAARPQRAFDEIIAQVRTLVQQGRLTPGSKLPSERELAAQFEVSRNTVREAIRMLEITGLVTVRKGATGGAFITRLDPGTISKALSDSLSLTQYSLSDLTEARESVESTAVRLACERRTDEDLARMDELVRTAGKLAAEERWDEKALAIIEFHRVIADATQNPILSTMIRSLMELTTEFSTRLGGLQRDVTSQRKLLRHIRDQDADAAVAELVRNMRRIHRTWMAGSRTGATRR